MTSNGLLVSEYWIGTDVAYLRYYFGIYPEALMKTMTNIKQDSPRHDRDTNRPPLECKPETYYLSYVA
jgi:hypothetical protein